MSWNYFLLNVEKYFINFPAPLCQAGAKFISSEDDGSPFWLSEVLIEVLASDVLSSCYSDTVINI